MRLKVRIAVLWLFGLSFHNVVAQIDPALESDIQQVLDNHVQTLGNHGVSVCLIMPDGNSWTGTSGVDANNISITDSTVFHGASTTKANVAALLMLMDEAAELNLDSSWNNYVELDVEIDTTITIRQLISNTAGIADYLEAPGAGSLVTSDFGHAFTPQEILEDLVSPIPDFAPGTDFQYSSSNFTLAALVAETVSGNPIQQELRTRLWNPLGMNHTYFGGFETYSDQRAGVWWNFGSGVQDYGSEDETSMLTFAYGGGNIVSTPTDLAHFVRALITGQLLNSNSMNQMQIFSPQSYSTWTAGYGSGIHNASNFGSNSVLGHDGFYTNMTDMFHSLDHGFTLVTMTNTQTGWFAIFDDIYPIVEAYLTTSAIGEPAKSKISVYPNPAQSFIKVRMSQSNEILRVSITDFFGKGLKAINNLSSLEVSLDCMDMAPGSYILKVVTKDQVHTRTIQIQ